jgi:hypothetical protein
MTPPPMKETPMQRDPFSRRLDALEGRFAYRGCDTCITWNGFVVVEIDGETDAELSRSNPDRCPTCGREIPVRREIHLIAGGA